jgi:hypothetical protein
LSAVTLSCVASAVACVALFVLFAFCSRCRIQSPLRRAMRFAVGQRGTHRILTRTRACRGHDALPAGIAQDAAKKEEVPLPFATAAHRLACMAPPAAALASAGRAAWAVGVSSV